MLVAGLRQDSKVVAYFWQAGQFEAALKALERAGEWEAAALLVGIAADKKSLTRIDEQLHSRYVGIRSGHWQPLLAGSWQVRQTWWVDWLGR